MRDHQAIIDSAQAFLRRSDQTMTDELRDLATEFVELTNYAEHRLRRCEDFLRRGLLGEAIHQAELDPPVLEVVSLINFPGREEFDQVLTMYNLPVAIQLDVHRAMALNQAYVDHRKIEATLREHRLLALSRAPLGERLGVLRQLALLDTENPVWNDDIQLLEKPALDEIKKRAQTAWYGGDDSELQTVLAMFQSGGWSSPEVPGLAAQIQNQLAKLQLDRACQNLPVLAKELRRAMRGNDLATTQTTLQRLYQELQLAGVQPEDPHYIQATQASNWLQEQYTRQQAQAAFDQEVQTFQSRLTSTRTNLDEIETGFEKLERFGLPIPDPIKKTVKRLRQKARDEQIEKEARMNRAMNNTLLAIVAPIALGVVIIMGIMIVRILRSP